MKEQRRLKIEVAVYDYKSRLLPNAKVTLKPLMQKQRKIINLKFDKRWQVYRAYDVSPGPYLLKAEAESVEFDQREVLVHPSDLKEIFILGKKGMPFYYRGKVKVPFELPRDLLGVAVKPAFSDKQEEELRAYARELKLQSEEVGEPIRKDNVRVFRFSPHTVEQDKQRTQQSLSKHPLVRMVGPVIRIDKESVSFLTNELVVKFKAHITKEEVATIVKRYNLDIIRTIPYAGNAFLLRTGTQASYAILKICAEIVQSGIVEYAEPNLFSTVVEDQVNPTDFLCPEQWHLQLIHAADAWQALQNLNPNLTFGDPNIIIAVMDSGVDANNPDFTGNLTNGNPKIYQLYDFFNMVANNNSLGGSHGTCCAGVATALANNPSVIAGQNEGVVGMGGNCRLIGLRHSGPETMFSDAYIWAAGFDPNSTTPSFPNPVSPSADIITNSFGYSIGAPISGLMQDTFDYLTTYGRNGKGVLLFFSTGNSCPPPAQDFTLLRPWAAYEKTLAIAASTLANDGVTEVHADYSNFGGNGVVDLCAPSCDVCGAVHNPPLNYGITTTTISGLGNKPSHAAQQTTLTTNVATGGTTLNVVNNAGFAVNQWILVDQPGQPQEESVRITAIPLGGTQLVVTALLHGHPAGTAIIGGPNNCVSNFGGTSAATPMCAGVAALMLSANPDLSWVEVRRILRETASKIDAANADPIGRWVDVNGNISTAPGYLGPHYSRWYGLGRVDAEAAVQQALNLVGVNPLNNIDTWIKENSIDVGDVPCSPPYSPDVWVRNFDPAIDNPAQVTQHQSPIRGQDNWVYANVRNRGALDSYDVYVRILITRWAGTQYVYPDDFIPTVQPSTYPVATMAPGTYLIGEVHVGSIPAGGFVRINTKWRADLIPPASVVINGVAYSWADSCLLVDVSPHDGPTPTGPNTWDNNNLCQRNITIVDPSDSDDLAIAFVVGHHANVANVFNLRVDRKHLPAGVKLLFDYVDKGIANEAAIFLDELKERTQVLDTYDVTILTEAKGEIHYSRTHETHPVTIAPNTRLTLPCHPTEKPTKYQLNPILKDNRVVFELPTAQRTYVPIPRKGTEYQIVALLAKGLKNLKKGEYQIDIYQENLAGKIEGGINLAIRKK